MTDLDRLDALAASGLDAAWAEAEAALPAAWTLSVEKDAHRLYRATAWRTGSRSGTAVSTVGSFGDEAAALRALAARLGVSDGG